MMDGCCGGCRPFAAGLSCGSCRAAMMKKSCCGQWDGNWPTSISARGPLPRCAGICRSGNRNGCAKPPRSWPRPRSKIGGNGENEHADLPGCQPCGLSEIQFFVAWCLRCSNPPERKSGNRSQKPDAGEPPLKFRHLAKPSSLFLVTPTAKAD